MDALIVIIGLLVLVVAAWRWGVDSTDGVDSPEWARRRAWGGFGPRAGREAPMEFAIDILVARADHAERVRRAEQAARIYQALPPANRPSALARVIQVWRRWRGGLGPAASPNGTAPVAR